MPKVECQYLIFKASIARIKICLLVNNGSEVKLIDEFFVHSNKLSTFKLEKFIVLILKNSKIVQKLTKKTLVNRIIKDHSKQLIFYLTKLDAKFNSVDFIEKNCLSYGILCIDFVIENRIKTTKLNYLKANKHFLYRIKNLFSISKKKSGLRIASLVCELQMMYKVLQ